MSQEQSHIGIRIFIEKTIGLLLFGIVFIFIVAPVVRIGSFNLFSFKILPPLLALLSLAYIRVFPKKFLLLFMVLIFVLIYSFVHFQLAIYHDNSFVLRVGIGILILLGALFIVLLFKKHFGSKASNKIINAVILTGSLNSMIMLLQLLFPSFRELTDQIFLINAIDDGTGTIVSRINGLSSSAGAVLSVIVAGCLILLHYKLVKLKIRDWNYLQTSIILLSLIFGLVFSGRTGILLIFLYAFAYYLKNFDFKVVFKYSLISILVIISLLLVLDTFSKSESSVLTALSRTIEVVIRIREEGTIRTDSTDDLSSMYVLPNNQSHLIFGDGNFGRQKHLPYVPSDVFYIRVIFGLGILGLIIFIIPILITLMIALDNESKIKSILLFFILASFVLNFKEAFYFGTAGFSQLLSLMIALHLSSNPKEEVFDGLKPQLV